ncbi:hypothetical protein [Chryseobacterium indologenes]|uniref:Uncharacterized protein n=1 Tax=Chryseobacterium indologenes TaxID=253 RepID=A0A0N0ZW63_CHRID|nr:hypothetical protein [Chryseobacterium indologenes]KPE49519.1 hypothetical protein AOB46_19415 [Chryseobacterium indologenes]
MSDKIRFTDQNKTISDFYDEVWVVCTVCGQKAFAKTDREQKKARLFCPACGYNKETSMESCIFGYKALSIRAAHVYFGAELWLQHSFKDDIFCAYNGPHLEYLENYIAADLREHKDRTHFTLLEKLPRFYHEAKNRKSLLAIIERLKNK